MMHQKLGAMKNKSYLVIFSVLCFTWTSQAQVKRSGKEDTLKTRIVTVFDYKPTVSDAKKLAESPSTIDTVLPKPQARFSFDTRQLTTSYTPDSIRAAKMKGEPLDPLFRSFVKGGLGNGINYMLDGYVDALRSRDGALGLHVHGKAPRV